ncbi:zinc finger (C3HC4 RING finger) protein, putative [Eimeria brunetti]|uniref:Zinc finger (C3HC4 RING finger) protein, putative n=1 Tax=Eimeria brunetti TaxID=51314 RepID=U6LY68_9EIME|nr:zinc finger (C3HC4 RING finger) protein, putative [Eimeria brunetti]
MRSSRHQDDRPIHSAFTSGMRNFLSRGASGRSTRGNLPNRDTATNRVPPQQAHNSSMSFSASAQQTAGAASNLQAAGEVGGSLAAAVDPSVFSRYQSEEAMFRPPKVPFPPPSRISVDAVWSWQMGEGVWIPFDVRVMQLIESLWMHLQGEQQQDEPPDAVQGNTERTQEAGQPPEQEEEQQQEEQAQEQGQEQEEVEEQDAGDPTGERPSQAPAQYSHKLYVHLFPWRYCLDLRTMTQKNLSTHRVRPIRRVLEAAGLWFGRGGDGYAERFAPELEVHLENLWQESRGGRSAPGPLVIAWQDPSTGNVHYTDVTEMKESTGDGSYREIMRVELLCMPQAPSLAPDEAEHSLAVLPSLHVGNEESGEAICRGHKDLFDPDDLQAALVPVRASDTPDDACAICLETFVTGDNENSQEPQQQELQQQAHANTQSCSASSSDGSGGSSSSGGDSSPRSSSSCGGGSVRSHSNGSSSSNDRSDSSSNSSSNNSSTSKETSAQERPLSASVSEEGSDVESNELVDCDASSTSKSSFVDACGSEQEVVKLRHCPHHFHAECIRTYMQRCCRGGFFCPTCNVLQLPGNGPSPPGKMSWRISRHSLLAGHPTEDAVPAASAAMTRLALGSVRLLRYGYPDDTFLLRLAEELRARGFPLDRSESNEGATHGERSRNHV